MNIIIGSDHAGWYLKAEIIKNLAGRSGEVFDAGPPAPDRCDYSEYALIVARQVVSGAFERGILICGTGLGMSMAANRIQGARAVVCLNEYMARMSRLHNDANILCLGARVVGLGLALDMLETWLATAYEGGRHQGRLDRFDRLGAL